MTLHEKIAVWMIAVSWLICVTILLLPLLPIRHNKLVLAAVIYFATQVIFWTGCAIGGKEVVRRYRRIVPVKHWLARSFKIEDREQKRG